MLILTLKISKYMIVLSCALFWRTKTQVVRNSVPKMATTKGSSFRDDAPRYDDGLTGDSISFRQRKHNAYNTINTMSVCRLGKGTLPRVGVIIEWLLNWKFNDHRDVLLTSQLVVSNLTLTVVVKKMLELLLFYIKILGEIIN